MKQVFYECSTGSRRSLSIGHSGPEPTLQREWLLRLARSKLSEWLWFIRGSLPNDCFADVLGLPTIWVPHSYAGCCQHAPNEHVLAPIMREGLQIMTGLFWDLAEDAAERRAADRAL